MTLDELRNLKPEDFVLWPLRLKLQIAGVALLLVTVLFYVVLLQPLNAQTQQRKAEESQLKTDLREKQNMAAKLADYQRQLQEIDARFKLMLKQLPSKAEIPSLLDDITIAGRNLGLDFNLFQPLPEQVKEFDADVPIKMELIGDFNDMGNFAAAIAAMSRIVTLHDLVITRKSEASVNKAAVLSLACTAKTYRYLDEDEVEAQMKAKREQKP